MIPRKSRLAPGLLAALALVPSAAWAQGVAALPPGYEPEPIVQPLEGSPTVVMVVPGSRDRVTMIEPATRKFATLKLRGTAQTQFNQFNFDGVPIAIQAYSIGTDAASPDLLRVEDEAGRLKWRMQGLVHVNIPGPPSRQVALFDRRRMIWVDHDLAAPATNVSTLSNDRNPLVAFAAYYTEPVDTLAVYDAETNTWPTLKLPEAVKGYVPASVSALGTACFEVGRFVCVYNKKFGRWSVLELRPNPRRDQQAKIIRPASPACSRFLDGKLVVPEGKAIHLYDAGLGEWSRVDTDADGAH